MLKTNRRLAILIGFISLILFAVLFVVNLFYYDNNYSEIRLEYVNNSTNIATEIFEYQFNKDYLLVENYLVNSKSLNEVILFGESEIYEVIDRVNDEIIISSTSYQLKDLDILNENIAIYKLNDLLKDKETGEIFETPFLAYYYPDLEKLVLITINNFFDVSFNDNINNVIVVDNAGFIYFSKISFGEISNLTSLLKLGDDIKLLEGFVKNNSTTSLQTRVNKKLSYVSLSKLTNTQNFLLVYPENIVSNQTRGILYIFIVSSLAAFILLEIALILSILIMAKKFNDVEMNRFTLFYNKPPIIYITRKGHIKGFNNTFKRDYPSYKDIESLDQIFLIEFNELMLLIRKQHMVSGSISINDNVVQIEFIPLKALLGYALVGIPENAVVSNDEYKYLALYNEVTNLYNVNSFMQYTKELINSLKINSAKYTFIMLNVVDFRNINRLIGESAANELIKDIAKDIIKTIPVKEYKIFHTKIDNFILVFKELKDNSELISWAEQIADKYLKKISDKNLLAVDIRFGLYETNNKTIDLAAIDIYNNLKQTTKFAKTLTTKSIVVYDQTTESYYKNLKTMEQDLIKAIENEEFEMYLQPQVNNITNKIIGFEALIRWNNPKYQYESTQKFITLAEERNLIVDIGNITIKKTLEIARKLKDENIVIAINVSPLQILQIGFVQFFLEMVEYYQVQKEMIAIEITETVLMSSFSVVNEKIKQLKDKGIKIHLDDFGTGYSSLKYLEQLNVDTIKIDKDFMDGYPNDKFKRETVKFITNLAKNLDLEIVVEGVETKIQNEQLKKMGANIIQGYLISKAVRFDEAVKLLKKYNHGDGVDKNDI